MGLPVSVQMAASSCEQFLEQVAVLFGVYPLQHKVLERRESVPTAGLELFGDLLAGFAPAIRQRRGSKEIDVSALRAFARLSS